MVFYRKNLLIRAALSVLACIVMASSSHSFGQSLGQLFTSPQERLYLDQLRQEFLDRTASQGFDIQSDEFDLLTDISEEQNVEFSLGGIAHNRSGTKTIWLNGAAISEDELPTDVDIVQIAGQEILRIRTSQKTHYLKPGQTLNIETGERWESYESKPAAEILDSAIILAQNTSPADVPQQEARRDTEGVVAIKDLIEALQQIQAGNNEDTQE